MTREQAALLKKAYDSLRGAKLLARDGLHDFAASRAYYTMFYVAEALLLGEELSFSKHTAVIAAFGRRFARTGVVPAEFHWKRQIVYLLDEVLQGRHSHVLMATHSSIVLTDVSSEDIIILKREGPYTTQAFNPFIQTFAADPSDILVHVFGGPQALGEQSVTRIQTVLDGLPDLNPDEQRKQLQELLAVVGPGYWSYRIRRALQDIEGG
jgi:uncharacterized protein (UPF0332 family)